MNAHFTYVSDLHLEFYTKAEKWPDIFSFLDPSVVGKPNSCLILGGDIGNFARPGGAFQYFLRSCAEVADKVLYIAGNHEFYNGTWPAGDKYLDPIREIFKDTEFWYADQTTEDLITINGVRVLAGTMWTDFNGNPLAEETARNYIADFMAIQKREGGRFWPKDAKTDFQDFIDLYLREKPQLVVSHFLASRESTHPRFRTGRDAGLNPYFNPEPLDRFYDMHVPEVWVHGHTHDRCDYVHQFGTKVLANPVGYPGESNVPHSRTAEFTITPKEDQNV